MKECIEDKYNDGISNLNRFTYFDYNGKLWRQLYYNNNGKLHREDGACDIMYYSDSGKTEKEEYLINGIPHRAYGPSDIHYDKNGNITDIEWFYNDKFYTNKVKDWMKENNFDNWQDMYESDFNRMWMEIL